MYVMIVYTQQGSVEVLQVTGSLLLLIFVCLRSYCEFLRVAELLPEPLGQFVCLVDNYRRTVTVYHINNAMASGDSRPKADWSGVSFRN